MIQMLLGPIAEVAKTWVGGKVAVSKAKADAKAKQDSVKDVELAQSNAEDATDYSMPDMSWNEGDGI